MDQKSLIKYLCCPRCTSALEFSSNKMFCVDCHTEYNYFDGMPSLFCDSELTRVAWKQAGQEFIDFHQKKIKSLSALDSKGNLSRNAKQRIDRLYDGYVANIKNIESILSQLLLEQKGTSHEAVLPQKFSEVRLEAYYNNAFRDWSWQTEETELLFAPIKDLLAKEQNLGVCALFGAGFGNFSLKLDKSFDKEILISMDNNPLMLGVARRLFDGEGISLVEFPVAPKKAEYFAVSQTLDQGERPSKNHHLVLGDVLSSPIPASSLDTLVTPWIIDVLPEDFATVLQRMNCLLKMGGLWANTGTLNFQGLSEEANYSVEEVMELFGQHGFETIATDERKVPYLQSPYSRNERYENIFSFLVKKNTHCKMPKSYGIKQKFLVDTSVAIPLSESLALELYQRKVQWETLSAVDGKRSIDQISDWISARYKLELWQAQEAVLSFFNDISSNSKK